MAYKLTLTKEERKAIDWVGNRYSNGWDLYRLLWKGDYLLAQSDIEWDSDCDITFKIPEHVAWQIKENSESEDGFWPCFADELASKMQRFVDAIV